ncbi:MAG: hypothetical protein OEQ13_01245 [Acidobacteriota bacterium]|nr:hypothetical protein [Acidobacteriota bacterium]
MTSRSGSARLAMAAALIVVATAGLVQHVPAQEGADVPPQPSRVRERVEVRLVQIDVSVIDPKQSSYSSVRGLVKDDFIVRLDGRDLSAEQRDRMRVDEICDEAVEPLRELAAAGTGFRQEVPDRPVLVFIDFNYLDAQGRQNAARALDKIADSVDERRAAFKVYGYTRELRLLTSGFTRSADELRSAAGIVRQTAFRTMKATGLSDSSIPADNRGSFTEFLNSQTSGIPGVSAGSAGPLLQEIAYANAWGDALSEYDPSSSLAALRTILLAHAHIPWRKALVVFSSESFRFTDEQKENWELLQIRELARKGYTIWTVDVEGISRVAIGVSRLLSSIAADSGGGSLRRTADIVRAIDGASEQLACYYLISLPVSVPREKEARHTLTVQLNREDRSKEEADAFFRYQVRSPSEVFIPTRESRTVETRLSALLSPDDFTEPPVGVTLDFPVRMAERNLSKTRIRVPLSEISWEPSADGKSVVAKVLAAAVVERHTKRGQEQVCGVDAEQVGPLELSLPAEPHPESRAALAIEFPCVLEKDGMYAARGILTDLASGKTGAGRSTVIVERKGTETWHVLAPRVEAVSGLDLVWGPGAKRAERDRSRIAWRAVGRKGSVLPDEEVALRYVLCGPDASAAGGSLRHFLVRRTGELSVIPVMSFGAGSLRVLAEGDGDPFCAQAAIVLPEFTLEQAGEFAFVVTAADAEVEALEAEVAEAIRERRTRRDLSRGLHAVVPFVVALR